MNLSTLYPHGAYAYIYALSDPRTKAVRYIGKTFNPAGRYSKHCKAAGKTHKDCWIKQLKAAGLSPDFDVVDILSADDELGFFKAEAKWIDTFRSMGFNLTNLMDGGGSGGSHSPETIERMRFAQNNRSEETKLKNALVALARRGSKHTPESIAKMRAAHAAISEETRAKMRESQARSALNPERSRKLSLAGRGRKQTQEAIAKVAAANTGKKRTEEQRARISAGIKAACARRTPEKLAQVRQAYLLRPKHTAEARAKMSASHKGWKPSDEWREKQRLAHTGKPHYGMRGKKFSEESKLRMKLAQQARRLAEKGVSL